mmetsp:Transcript_19583/g.54621  ORF Transcript_19583/g.54621 Transcript_19583/m.54621 type:complete len:538 (-) Transcript_19583:181-1794(-)
MMNDNNINDCLEEDSDDEAPDLIALGPDPNENDLDATSGAPALMAANANDDKNRGIIHAQCPVTILSGFLGSGKTTLIQYILKSPNHGKRIAVIENEFGEGLAIESLIARDGIDPGSGSLQELIELPNGCVCCTVKDSLVETLENLVAKRSDLDYILIEASGMADPGPIASVFWLDDALESRLKLDGIVTLVDGRHILDQLEATEEAARQIAYADRILLNKVDLLQPSSPEGDPETTITTDAATSSANSVLKVETAIRRIHPTAPILRTSFSKVPNLDWILDADCFGGSDHLEKVGSRFQDSTHAPDATNSSHDHTHEHHQHHQHGDNHDCSECCHHDEAANHHDHHHGHHEHHHGHHEHTHTTSITTVSFEHSGSVDVRKLNAWLADILWPNQDETDKVLTAMLYRGERDASNQNEHQVNHKTSTEQQIFRMKGILSVYSSDEFSWQEEDDAEDSAPNATAGAGAETNDANTGSAAALLDPRRFIVQSVYDLWDIQPVTSADLYWKPEEERTGKIVVIGKSLRQADLKAGFEACFV